MVTRFLGVCRATSARHTTPPGATQPDLLSPRFGVVLCSLCQNPRAETIPKCPECFGRGSGRTHRQIAEGLLEPKAKERGLLFITISATIAQILQRQWYGKTNGVAVRFISHTLMTQALQGWRGYAVADHSLPLRIHVKIYQFNGQDI